MFGMPNRHPLSRVVTRLTMPHYWIAQDGNAGLEQPLLLTLQQAVASTSGKGSAAGVSRTGSPIDLGAVVLLDTITAVVRDHAPGGRRTTAGEEPIPLVRQLARWASWASGTGEIETEFMLAHCTGWEQDIRLMLDPPKEVPLRDVVCPQCHIAYYTSVDPDGGTVQQPVLIAYPGEKPLRVECCLCGRGWYGQEQLTALRENT